MLDWAASIHAFDPRLGMFYQRVQASRRRASCSAYYATATP
jgi:hypothetical protein